MSLCLGVAAILIMAFGLEEESLSVENTVAGYFVVVFVAVFVGICILSLVYVLHQQCFSAFS